MATRLVAAAQHWQLPAAVATSIRALMIYCDIRRYAQEVNRGVPEVKRRRRADW